jgi:hypothetical protein
MKTRTFATITKEESGKYYIPPQPPTPQPPQPSEPEIIPEPDETEEIKIKK